MKIQIKEPMVVRELEVTLPFYFQNSNGFHTCYGSINEKLEHVEMQVRNDGTLFMMESRQLETYMLESCIANRAEHRENFKQIEEAVFSHHFAMHHRELFYKIFPDARPSI
jgi:hypothetical protein